MRVQKVQPAVSIPGTTGQQMAPISLTQDSTGQIIGQTVQNIGGMLSEATMRIRRREDYLNSIDAEQEFLTGVADLNKDFETRISEKNIVPEYNLKIDNLTSGIASKYNLSKDAEAKLHGTLRGHQGVFSRKMSETKHLYDIDKVEKNAYRELDAAQELIFNNPDLYEQQRDLIYDKIGGAADVLSADRFSQLQKNIDQGLAEYALNSLVSNRQFTEASLLMNEKNFAEFLPSDKYAMYKSQVDSGTKMEQEEDNKYIAAFEELSEFNQQAGLGLSSSDIAQMVVPSIAADTPSARLQTMAEALARKNGTTPEAEFEGLPDSVVMQAYGFPSVSESTIDHTKDRDATTGQYTLGGISKLLAEPLTIAARASDMRNKIFSAVELFVKDGNSSALLSAMTTFQKMLDDGAVVREGDIKMQQQAQGLSARLATYIQQLDTGQALGTGQIKDMITSTSAFVRPVLETEKAFIDEYKKYAVEHYGRPEEDFDFRDIGVPNDSYDRAFAKVKSINWDSLNKDVKASMPEEVRKLPSNTERRRRARHGDKNQAQPDNFVFDVGADMSITEVPQ